MAPKRAPPRPHDAPGLLPLPLPGCCPTPGGKTEAQDARSPVAQSARGGRRLSGKRDSILLKPNQFARQSRDAKRGLHFSGYPTLMIFDLKTSHRKATIRGPPGSSSPVREQIFLLLRTLSSEDADNRGGAEVREFDRRRLRSSGGEVLVRSSMRRARSVQHRIGQALR